MEHTPPTVLPPLKAVTATDQGGVLAITASLGLVFGVISLLIRTYVRIECRASFGRDDYTAFASMVVALLQSVVVFLAISRGFGKIESDLDASSIATWQRDLYVSDILFLITMWLTKSSIALLIRRLSRDPIHGIMARLLLAGSAIYFVISMFVVTLRCDISQPWNTEVTGCPTSTYSRWFAVTVLDIITEIALFVGGFWLVRDLQLPWSKKSVVVIAYGLRLPVVVAAAVRLYYIRKSLYSEDQSLHGILASVCTQVELSYAVIATTMPCLKPFMSALNTQYGGGNTFVLSQTSPNSSAAQRSRDTGGVMSGGGINSNNYGTSSAKEKAKARAKAMAGAVMMSGAKSANGGKNTKNSTLTTSHSRGGSIGGGLTGSKARKSTESEKGILEVNITQTQHGSGNHSSSDSDENVQNSMLPSGIQSIARSNTKTSVALPAKTTTITASGSPYTSRPGAQSPSGVAVTTDITVTEEKNDNASGSPLSSPALPSFPDFDAGIGRIGHAR